jgi:hypothetical protein
VHPRHGRSVDQSWFGLTAQKRREIQGAKVVELTAYGPTGLMAIAFCFAYGDEFPPSRKKSSRDLTNNARLNPSRIIETTTGSLMLKRTVGEQQETTPASLLRKTSPVEAVRGAICNESSQNHRWPGKAFK